MMKKRGLITLLLIGVLLLSTAGSVSGTTLGDIGDIRTQPEQPAKISLEDIAGTPSGVAGELGLIAPDEAPAGYKTLRRCVKFNSGGTIVDMYTLAVGGSDACSKIGHEDDGIIGYIPHTDVATKDLKYDEGTGHPQFRNNVQNVPGVIVVMINRDYGDPYIDETSIFGYLYVTSPPDNHIEIHECEQCRKGSGNKKHGYITSKPCSEVCTSDAYTGDTGSTVDERLVGYVMPVEELGYVTPSAMPVDDYIDLYLCIASAGSPIAFGIGTSPSDCEKPGITITEHFGKIFTETYHGKNPTIALFPLYSCEKEGSITKLGSQTTDCLTGYTKRVFGYMYISEQEPADTPGGVGTRLLCKQAQANFITRSCSLSDVVLGLILRTEPLCEGTTAECPECPACVEGEEECPECTEELACEEGETCLPPCEFELEDCIDNAYEPALQPLGFDAEAWSPSESLPDDVQVLKGRILNAQAMIQSIICKNSCLREQVGDSFVDANCVPITCAEDADCPAGKACDTATGACIEEAAAPLPAETTGAGGGPINIILVKENPAAGEFDQYYVDDTKVTLQWATELLDKAKFVIKPETYSLGIAFTLDVGGTAESDPLESDALDDLSITLDEVIANDKVSITLTPTDPDAYTGSSQGAFLWIDKITGLFIGITGKVTALFN